MLEHHNNGKDCHFHQNQISDCMNNEISPLIMQSKRKREAFSEQEQEVCLTPIFASPESTLLPPFDSGLETSPMNTNVVPTVESIATVTQVIKCC